MRTVIVHEGVQYRAYNHIHATSADGRVLKIATLSPAHIQTRPDGYLGVGRQTLVHRIVAACWLKQPPGAKHVHHINGDKTDNRVENLEWLTPKEHIARHPGRGLYERTEATRQKLREYRLGTTTSEETKQKQREANLRLGIKPPAPQTGYRHTETALAKMRKNSPNAQSCRIAGVVYPSFSEAGRALGMNPYTLRQRCLSESSFPDHEMVE